MRDTATSRERGPAPTAKSAAPSRSSVVRHVRGAALWASLGFVCGAVFWHAVGFWNFMSDLMFDRAEATVAHATAPDMNMATDPIETGSLPVIYRVDPASCVSLELDRLTNRTAARPCPPEGLALRLNAEDSRGDIAVLADNVER